MPRQSQMFHGWKLHGWMPKVFQCHECRNEIDVSRLYILAVPYFKGNSEGSVYFLHLRCFARYKKRLFQRHGQSGDSSLRNFEFQVIVPDRPKDNRVEQSKKKKPQPKKPEPAKSQPAKPDPARIAEYEKRRWRPDWLPTDEIE